MSASHDNVEALFEQALTFSVEERPAFLAGACGNDRGLRRRLEVLLAAHESAGGFLPTEPGITSESAGPGLTISVAPVTEQPGDRIGRYKLLQKVGEGGCGVVYMAEQEEPVRRRVALKVIKLGMDTKSVIARFEAERQALALMDHPNIARVLDAGATDAGRPYFVMELVRGIKITDYCDQNNLATRDRLDLFIKVCQAIQHAHQKGIIHRDIKPSNILVTLHDGVAVPKVIDFGIAKATTDQRLTDKTLFTALEQFIGTPAYMSPEQAEMSGLDIDTRCDIYSLGVLLYELLTGKTPFDAKELLASGIDAMRKTIREQEPLRPSTKLSQTLVAANVSSLKSSGEKRATEGEVRADSRRLLRIRETIPLLRGDVDWIVMKCLEKDRARRYETANGLASDLQRHLNNEAVLARPPSAAYRFQKLVRRNKLAFTSVAAVITALVIGLGISLWQGIEKTRAYRRALAAEQEQSRLRREAESAQRTEAGLRSQAEVNEKRAQSEAARSQQVAQFLKDMLSGVGPSVALGRDTKLLREILDKTAERISRDLKDQPEVEADVRLTIGKVYGEIAVLDQAEAMFRQALTLRRVVFGPKHKDVAEALNNLGSILFGRLNMSAAESVSREALTMSRELLGPQNLEAARSLHILAAVAVNRGDLAGAESMNRDSLEIRRRLLGNEHRDVARSLNNLGLVLMDQGKLSDAETLFSEALAIQRKLLGNEHPDLGAPLNNLALVLSGQEKFSEAETMFGELVIMQRKLLGITHPSTALTLRNLIDVLLRQKKFADIGKLFQQLRSLEASNPAGITRLSRIEGEVGARRSQWPEAIVGLRHALELDPTDHETYHYLAPLLVLTGDVEAYRQLCHQMRTRFDGTADPVIAERMVKACLLLPPSPKDLVVIGQWVDVAVTFGPEMGWHQLAKGLADYRQGRFSSAGEWLRRSLRGPDPNRDGIAEPVLAMALYQLKQGEEARIVLARALERARTSLPRLDGGHLSERGYNWNDVLTAHILLCEARELIEAPIEKVTEQK